MEDVIYLRRLTTKDGIVGPIEIMNDPRPRELRQAKPDLGVFICEEQSILSESGHGLQTREYYMKKQKHAILIEMEEV